MAQKVWQGDVGTVAQVYKVTVDTLPASSTSQTLTGKITGQEGSTTSTTISYTAQAGDTTIPIFAASVVANWNGSGDQEASNVTASNSSGTISWTADTPGKPFTFTLGGATSLYTDTGNDPASSSPSDYTVTQNWVGGAIPATSDDVVIPAGTPDILYNLNQSAVALKSLTIEKGYNGKIGGTDGAYFQTDVSSSTSGTCTMDIGGTSWIDLGATDINVTVNGTATGSDGTYGLNLKGTKLPKLIVNKGSVGFGTDPAETSAANSYVTDIETSYIDDEENDVQLTIGQHVVGTSTSSDLNSITQQGGTITSRANVTTVTATGQATYIQEKGVVSGAATFYNGSTFRPDANGSYGVSSTSTGVVLSGQATLDNSFDSRTKTLHSVKVQTNDCTVKDPMGKITYTNSLKFPNIKMDQCILDLGPDRTLAIT